MVVDASVWVSAADATDAMWESSRSFLSAAASRRVAIAVPTFAQVEIACALARRLRDGKAGRVLSTAVLRSLSADVHATDARLTGQAVVIGTDAFLRAADALYAALAARLGAGLVSWDGDLVRRAGAITPTVWLEKNELGQAP